MPLPNLEEFKDFQVTKNGRLFGSFLEDDGRVTTRLLAIPEVVYPGELELRLGPSKTRAYLLSLAWLAGFKEADRQARIRRLRIRINLVTIKHLTLGEAAMAIGISLDHFRRELKRNLGPRWRLVFEGTREQKLDAQMQAAIILKRRTDGVIS